MTISDEIIERFLAVFGEPKTPNPEVFINEFARSMDGYDETALRAAADNLIKSSTFWPKPAELLGEARRIISDRTMHRPAEHQSWKPIARTDEQRAMADELVAQFKKFLAERTTVSEAPPPIDWKRGQRDGFREMQRNSPNPGLHMTREGLSALSRRITGEHEE